MEVAIQRSSLLEDPDKFIYKVLVLVWLDKPIMDDELRKYALTEVKGNEECCRVVLGRSKENFDTAEEALKGMMDQSADMVNAHYLEIRLPAHFDTNV